MMTRKEIRGYRQLYLERSPWSSSDTQSLYTDTDDMRILESDLPKAGFGGLHQSTLREGQCGQLEASQSYTSLPQLPCIHPGTTTVYCGVSHPETDSHT